MSRPFSHEVQVLLVGLEVIEQHQVLAVRHAVMPALRAGVQVAQPTLRFLAEPHIRLADFLLERQYLWNHFLIKNGRGSIKMTRPSIGSWFQVGE